ncbi:unnamed protein product [Symbiodinium sp. CCMP2456]|nr:unnamed protein product [Symbiodinium sp. CCMP2456]
MSDYHPDGGQLFWPRTPVPFTVCLGPASAGDDIKPEDMRAFHVPQGKGIYIHPGTWPPRLKIDWRTGCGIVVASKPLYCTVAAHTHTHTLARFARDSMLFGREGFQHRTSVRMIRTRWQDGCKDALASKLCKKLT